MGFLNYNPRILPETGRLKMLPAAESKETEIIEEKAALRRRLRQARAALRLAERAAAERKANALLKRCIKRGGKIGLYWPVGKEMRLHNLIQTALQRGAQVYLPYIEAGKRRLWFTRYTAQTQQRERRSSRSKLDIPQFAGDKIRVHRLDLLLVPLVGIDKQGYRLGQAGGFYDATLAQMKHRRRVRTLGVGFACQMVEALPREPHDLPLDGFVCERGCFRFKRGAY